MIVSRPPSPPRGPRQILFDECHPAVARRNPASGRVVGGTKCKPVRRPGATLPPPAGHTAFGPRMIHSFIFSEGKLVGRDLELEALRLVHGDKGLIVWVDLDNPTDEESRSVLEGLFQFHPLAIEDCMTPSP